jgi:RNA polymerase sigma-70 factor (ECF subfamily)
VTPTSPAAVEIGARQNVTGEVAGMVEPWEADVDVQLLGRISQADQAAMMVFYDRHFGFVAGYCRKVLKDRAQADEVIQDAFLQVWRLASTYDPAKARPTTWLLVLARSRCLDALRRTGRRAEFEQLDAFETDAVACAEATPPDPTAVEAGRRLERARVRQAMASLPEEQRDALSAAYLLGMTAQQIAQARNIPLGTAKTRIRLGIRRLRGLMEVDRRDA